MPIIDVSEQELQVIVNALAMQHPLVKKLMEQHQEQYNANSDPQRRAADAAPTVEGAGPGRGNSHDTAYDAVTGRSAR